MAEGVERIAKAAGINENTALQLASAYNSRQVARSNPADLADRLLRYPSEIFTDTMTINGEKVNVPLNLEYAERYMRAAHIVAAKQPVKSATLGRKITSISFFDLEKVGTRDQIETQKREMLKRMGGLMDTFPSFPNSGENTDAQMLLRDLQNPHTDSGQLTTHNLSEKNRRIWEYL